MTTHFHAHPGLGHEITPALITSHVIGETSACVTMRIGIDTLYIHAGLPEVEQLACAFREAANDLCDHLEEGPARPEAVSA